MKITKLLELSDKIKILEKERDEFEQMYSLSIKKRHKKVKKYLKTMH